MTNKLATSTQSHLATLTTTATGAALEAYVSDALSPVGLTAHERREGRKIVRAILAPLYRDQITRIYAQAVAAGALPASAVPRAYQPAPDATPGRTH